MKELAVNCLLELIRTNNIGEHKRILEQIWKLLTKVEI